MSNADEIRAEAIEEQRRIRHDPEMIRLAMERASTDRDVYERIRVLVMEGLKAGRFDGIPAGEDGIEEHVQLVLQYAGSETARELVRWCAIREYATRDTYSDDD